MKNSISEMGYLRIVFILYLLISRINIFGYNFHEISVTIPMALFAVATLLIVVKKNYNNFKYFNRLNVLFSILFIILCVLTSYINVRRIPLFNVMTNIIIFFMLFIIDGNIEKERKIISEILVYSISIVSVISVIFWMLEKMNITLFGYTSLFQMNRFIGVIRFYDTPNGVAITAFVGLVLSVLFIKNNKFLFSLFAFFNFISVILTESRSTLFSLIIFFVFFALFLYKKKNKVICLKKIVSIIVVIIFLLAICFYFSTHKRFTMIFESNYELDRSFLDVVTNYRYSMYKEAFILSLKSPLIGNGLNTFVSNSKLYFGDNSYAAVFTGENPHNLLLALFYYTGIIGLVLIGTLLFNVFKNIMYSLKSNSTINICCEAVIVIGIFVYSFLDVNILFHVQITGFIFWLFSGYFINNNI